MDNEKVFAMPFAEVYPMLIAKAERKGRTKDQVLEVTAWLTGYTHETMEAMLESDITYGDFLRKAPALNPNRTLIKGSICGVKAERMNQYDNPEFFEEYAKMPRSQLGLSGAGEWHQLEPLFPELSGKTVLDLGCGHGWHCKYAADRGADTVLGIDRSVRMIEEAKRRNSADRIKYQVCDLLDFAYPEGTYDLVISNLVLHYLEDLDTIYKRIHRTLKPGGVFLFNIEHPTFTAGVNQQFALDGTWPVTDYYYSSERTTDFLGHAVKKYHHTLTQILNDLLRTGFAIEAVEEAMPPEQWRDQMPDEMKRPMMLLVRARKSDF